MVSEIGYSRFFLFTALISIPIALLILFIGKHTVRTDN
jgi:hypothetical protein